MNEHENRYVALKKHTLDLYGWGSTWPHWTIHVLGKHDYLHKWSHCGDSTSC